MKNKKSKAVPAALFSMICVQSGASIAKQLFPVIGASATSTLRIGLSAILLTIINKPKVWTLSLQQWKYAVFYGLGIGGMNLIFYFAIQRIPLGLAVTVEFVGPLLLALYFSRRLLDVVWALFACAGIMMIVPWNTGSIDPIGLILAFTAGLFWAGYIIVGGRISKVMDSKIAVTTGMWVATLIILPFGIFGGQLGAVDFTVFVKALGVAVLSSALPYSLDLMALKELPAKTFSILTSLHPAFAALSGLIFLHEHLSLLQWTSIACVIVASLGSTIFGQRN